MLKETELAVRLDVVAKRRAAGFDRIGDDRAHGFDQTPEPFRRLAGGAHQAAGGAPWRKLRPPQRLGDVDVAEAGDELLIGKRGLQRCCAAGELLGKRLGGQFVTGRLEPKVSQERMRLEVARRDQQHEAKAARVVVDDPRSALQVEDDVVVRLVLGLRKIDGPSVHLPRPGLLLALDPERA